MVGRAPTGIIWAFPQNLKRAATIFRFSAVNIFKNEIFEKREIVAAHFRFWENVHTRWRSPDHKALLKCVVSVPYKQRPGPD
jgi:hypothetical protein